MWTGFEVYLLTLGSYLTVLSYFIYALTRGVISSLCGLRRLGLRTAIISWSLLFLAIAIMLAPILIALWIIPEITSFNSFILDLFALVKSSFDQMSSLRPEIVLLVVFLLNRDMIYLLFASLIFRWPKLTGSEILEAKELARSQATMLREGTLTRNLTLGRSVAIFGHYYRRNNPSLENGFTVESSAVSNVNISIEPSHVIEMAHRNALHDRAVFGSIASPGPIPTHREQSDHFPFSPTDKLKKKKSSSLAMTTKWSNPAKSSAWENYIGIRHIFVIACHNSSEALPSTLDSLLKL
ncbi:hypothetical protein HK096_001479, partial [Nowakowskiella sp. JEL0078]